MNIIITIVWIGLGIFFMAYSYNLGLGRLSSAGPGLMPFLIGLFLLLSGLCLCYGAIKKSRVVEHAPSVDVPAEETGEISLKKSIIMIVSLIAYALVMEQLGFVVATFLLLSVCFSALGVKRLWALGGSACTVLLCYFIFTYLGQRFPPGILRYIGFY
jgi:putative tricarboxylic transport membrane protein